MLLSYTELQEVVEAGYIRGVTAGAVNPTSIDVRLGRDFLIENAPDDFHHYVDLAARESVSFSQAQEMILLQPMEFVLAHTVETFHMPNHLSAEFSLKSSIARNGLEHLNACWIDAGFNKSALTLELKNMTRFNKLMLTAGMFIGQIKIFKHTEVPEDQSYSVKGRYNGDVSVCSIKP